MANAQSITGIIARKQCYALANSILKIPLFLAEPIEGVQTTEVSYYGFTLLNVLSSPGVQAVKLSSTLSDLVFPTAWNYLDGTCLVSAGLSQVLNENNYRQTQMKVKGFLNILSGIQAFLFSYNPSVTAALGITGAPTALAGISFALSALIEVITSSIDFYNAYKEQEINGWLEEKSKEYSFISKRIEELEAENEILNPEKEQDWVAPWFKKNQVKIEELRAEQKQLKETILIRYRVNFNEVSNELKASLNEELDIDTALDLRSKTTDLALDQLKDQGIQRELNQNLQKARDTLFIKAMSFIGMSLIAVGTFVLLTTCPAAVGIAGLAISVVVASLYLYRHQQEIMNKMGSLQQSVVSFFNEKFADQQTDNEIDLSNPNLNS